MSRTITMEVYKVSELSERAKMEAYNAYCSDSSYAYSDDNEKTLEAFEKIFPVEVTSWEYGGYGEHISFDFTESDEVEELSGIRLMKYIWNNYKDNLFKGKYYSKSKWVDGKYQYKDRRSNVILDNSGVLTGYCIDDAMLQPIYDFLNSPSKDMDFTRLMRKCLNSWLKACSADYDDYFSMESFIDTSEANDWEYDSDGNLI